MSAEKGRPGRDRRRAKLFPWGSTYTVPAAGNAVEYVSRTPCHADLVQVPAARAVAGRVPVRCPTCGRSWHVTFERRTKSLVAVWLA